MKARNNGTALKRYIIAAITAAAVMPIMAAVSALVSLKAGLGGSAVTVAAAFAAFAAALVSGIIAGAETPVIALIPAGILTAVTALVSALGQTTPVRYGFAVPLAFVAGGAAAYFIRLKLKPSGAKAAKKLIRRR